MISALEFMIIKNRVPVGINYKNPRTKPANFNQANKCILSERDGRKNGIYLSRSNPDCPAP